MAKRKKKNTKKRIRSANVMGNPNLKKKNKKSGKKSGEKNQQLVLSKTRKSNVEHEVLPTLYQNPIASMFALNSNQSYSPDDNSLVHQLDYTDSDERHMMITESLRDRLVRKAVEVPVNDSLASWREIENKELKKLDETLNFKGWVMKAFNQTRTYGKCLLVPIITVAGTKINLGTTLDNVLSLDGEKKIERLLLITDFKASDKVTTDILDENHNLPISYKVNKIKIHHSRCILFGENDEISEVDYSITNTSFLEDIIPYVNEVHERNFEVTRAVKESNIIILKTDFAWIKDLLDDLSLDGGEGSQLFLGIDEYLSNRLKNLRENANNQNAYAIDKNKEEVDQLSKKNIKDMIEAVKHALVMLSGIADIPQSRYLNTSSSGLAGNTIDISNYVQSLNGMRANEVEPQLKSLDTFFSKIYTSINNFDFEWNPLAIQEDNNQEAEETTSVAKK